ncbi:hypothetical protein [Bradyrhizobium monzae]|uniref:hypothetical protein n=1 Tax=Bradyrhizobium sp. Oc8 TaxID=2876780 RepID=UPI001F2C55BF|nr:hypothetical protein [Bradyrhizobium sp. Oc8]
MDSTLDDKLTEGPFASLEEQLSNLARDARVHPRDPQTGIETLGRPLPTIRYFSDWRYLAFVGSLLAASIGFAAWWWSSSVYTETIAPSDPAPLTQAAPTAIAQSSDFAQQLQSMAHDLATLRETVAQLEMRQGQLVRDNENVANQLKASQAEIARNNDIIDQIRATQIRAARESETVAERLNASQEQLARVIANASEPKLIPEEPKVSPEEPKVTSEIPLPRPRQPTNIAQTHNSAPPPARPQAKKPQPALGWPWSAR